MNSNHALIGLNITSSLAVPDDENFLPTSWPPSQDFPISLDHNKNVISRYGDSIWDITPWAGVVTRLNFGDGASRKGSLGISPENSQLFRQLVAFWIYGPRALREVRTLVCQYELLRALFTFCSKEGVLASEIYRFPRLVEQLKDCIWPSMANRFLSLLHSAWEQRDELGFFILDKEGLVNLERSLPNHEKSQTAYIPPRIWVYQVNRLREFLDDFLTHKEKIEECYLFCLSAFAENAGSLTNACTTPLIKSRRPFTSDNKSRTGERSGVTFHGAFHETAKRFGIHGLLDKWLCSIDVHGVAILSAYFSLVGQVGNAYLLNFSLMRIEESTFLRAGCLNTEVDSITGEDIHLLTGVTTKTIEDDNACWITSPSAQVAVDAMSVVSRLRMIAARANPMVPVTDLDIDSPYLDLRPYEPWRRKSDYIPLPMSVRPSIQQYGLFIKRYPKIFDLEKIRITKDDLDAALLITPSLSPESYAVGKIWPFAWHQLRRTGAVNMNASGVVGDSSVQYQLKHATRAMTRYYGQGFHHLKAPLNAEAKAEYVRAMYEMVAREFSLLASPRFVSPHGEKRKAQILEIISTKDHKALISAAKAGTIGYRENMFGGCTSLVPCPYGGIDNVSHCGGGDGKPPCLDLLIDKKKSMAITKLGETLQKRLSSAPEGSPLQESLKFQITAVEKTLNVIKAS